MWDEDLKKIKEILTLRKYYSIPRVRITRAIIVKISSTVNIRYM